MTKKRNVFFDTNAYRSLVRGLTEAEVINNFTNIVDKEKKLNLKGSLIPVVMIELMSHLSDKTDPHFNECYNALNASYIHTKNENGTYNVLLDFDANLCSILFDIESEHLKEESKKVFYCYKQIISKKSQNLTEKDFSNFNQYKLNINKLKNDFKIILKNVLLGNERDEVVENNILLTELPGGQEKSETRNVKIELIEDIKNNSVNFKIAKQQVERAYRFIKVDIKDEIKLEKEIELTIEYFLPMFTYMESLLKRIVGNAKINFENPKFRNSYLDFYILYVVNKLDDALLITNDKHMINAVVESGYKERVMTTNEYLRFIDYDV